MSDPSPAGAPPAAPRLALPAGAARRYLAECEQEALHRSGAILPHGALLVADAWFLRECGKVLWNGDNLGRQIPGYPLSETAGVLALRLGPDLRLYLCRSEYIHEVAWGGR